MSWKARFLWAFLVSLVITVLAAVTAIIFDDLPFSEEIIITALLFALHSLAALIGAVLWQRRRARMMIRLGAGATIAGGLIWIGMIWADELDLIGWSEQEWIARVAGSLSTVGIALLVRGLVLWPQNRNKAVTALSVASWSFGAVAAMTLLSVIWLDRWISFEDLLLKTFGSSLVLAIGCVIGVFIVERLTRGDLIDTPDGELGISAPVGLDCPRCGLRVELRANAPGRCAGCRLRLRVEFQEPRCGCGYLLYGLAAEICPECGKPVPEELRWGGASLAPGVPPPIPAETGESP